MRRLVPLLGAVLALALSGTAAADTFGVVRPHKQVATHYWATGGTAGIPFTAAPTTGPMSFTALRGIWQAAGDTYGIPWEVLAAINKVETDFGRNLGPSSAGAIGWMQFMPSTWARWGVDANGDGIADPNNPTDAIFSAARYLAACGGQTDIAGAVYCYNHADWYVSEVLNLATLYSEGGGAGLFSADQLQTQLSTAGTQVATAHKQLAAALVQARKLARVEQRFVRKASTAKLLSDQLAAQKRAVQLGAHRDAVMARVSRLRGMLTTATEQLNSAQNEASSLPFATNTGLAFDRIDQGVDYTSSHPYAALGAGTVVYIDPNFWQGTPAVYEQLDTPIWVNGHSYDEIYYSETKALVQVGQQLVPGQAVTAPGSAEIGFASGNLPAAHAIYHEGDATAAGRDFYTYMTAGSPGGEGTPSRFFLLSGMLDNFQPNSGNGPVFAVAGGSATSFSSNVVYFTH